MNTKIITLLLFLSACEGTQWHSLFGFDVRTRSGPVVPYDAADEIADNLIAQLNYGGRNDIAKHAEQYVRDSFVVLMTYEGDHGVEVFKFCTWSLEWATMSEAQQAAYFEEHKPIDVDGCTSGFQGVHVYHKRCFYDSGFAHELMHLLIHKAKLDCDPSRCGPKDDIDCEPCLGDSTHKMFPDLWVIAENARQADINAHAGACLSSEPEQTR